MNSQNNEMMERKTFVLPDLVTECDFSEEELADSMDGLNLSIPRVKIPGGGTLQFEIPTGNPDNPNYEKTLEGVILYQHSTNSFWPEGHDYDENVPPQCQALDGKLGIGTPGGLCAGCKFNQFGSGPNGKGKACKNMRALYLLQSGEYLPIQLTLPPTSLRPFSDFSNVVFLARRRAACGSVVQIGLKKANNGKDDYSVATFSKVRDFSGDELAGVRAYAESFKKQVTMLHEQRKAELEKGDDFVEMTEPVRPMPENGGHFAVGSGGTDAAHGDIVERVSPVRPMPENGGHFASGSGGSDAAPGAHDDELL